MKILYPKSRSKGKKDIFDFRRKPSPIRDLNLLPWRLQYNKTQRHLWLIFFILSASISFLLIQKLDVFYEEKTHLLRKELQATKAFSKLLEQNHSGRRRQADVQVILQSLWENRHFLSIELERIVFSTESGLSIQLKAQSLTELFIWLNGVTNLIPNFSGKLMPTSEKTRFSLNFSTTALRENLSSKESLARKRPPLSEGDGPRLFHPQENASVRRVNHV